MPLGKGYDFALKMTDFLLEMMNLLLKLMDLLLKMMNSQDVQCLSRIRCIFD